MMKSLEEMVLTNPRAPLDHPLTLWAPRLLAWQSFATSIPLQSSRHRKH